MRTRVLFALILLTLVLAPAAARAGDLPRSPRPQAPAVSWSLPQLWAGLVSHLAKLWPTPPTPAAPTQGATTEGSGCIDPMGQPRCGAPAAPTQGATTEASGCLDPNGQPRCGS